MDGEVAFYILPYRDFREVLIPRVTTAFEQRERYRQVTVRYGRYQQLYLAGHTYRTNWTSPIPIDLFQ